MIHVTCDCGAKLDVAKDDVGLTIACMECGYELTLVAPGPVAADDAFAARLVVVAGPDRHREQFLLGGTADVEIGKLPGRHVALHHADVSRLHARLVRTADVAPRWRIYDCRSTNGVLVNGHRVVSQELADGDVLQIGPYRLVYKLT